jgi:hypothetical protein
MLLDIKASIGPDFTPLIYMVILSACGILPLAAATLTGSRQC